MLERGIFVSLLLVGIVFAFIIFPASNIMMGEVKPQKELVTKKTVYVSHKVLKVSSSSDSYHPYGYFYHPYPDVALRSGDIIIGHYPGQEYTIVGYWSHAGILLYYDSDVGDWIVVEALYEGVSLNTLTEFMSRYSDVIILRVYGVSDSEAHQAALFAYDRLGYLYDYNGYFKQVYGFSYYCSELVWASYYATTGINIDAYYWLPQNWYGVLPGEIVADGDTYQIWRSNLE